MLGNDIQADGRLVEKQHVGRVQQGGDQFHFHPLAQRQLADRLVKQLAHAEQIGQFVAGLVELPRLDAVDVLMEAERLGGGQVPPKLVLLPHHQGEAAAIGVLAFPGHMPHHPGRAAGGRDDAGKQLERGCLSRPVRPEKGDEFALFDASSRCRGPPRPADIVDEIGQGSRPRVPRVFDRHGRTSPALPAR